MRTFANECVAFSVVKMAEFTTRHNGGEIHEGCEDSEPWLEARRAKG